MTYKEFKRLDKFTQVDKTLEKGVAIGRRFEYGDFLKLFHMGAFYVELRYLEDETEIIAIYHSDDTALLEPYLHRINISELLRK